jgi:hypothetical protein
MTKKYYKKHRAERKVYNATYYAAHRQAIIKQNTEYYAAHRKEVAKQRARHLALHRKEVAKQRARQYLSHRKDITKQQALYRALHRTETSWRTMRFRCNNPTGRNAAYANVKVCKRWQSFKNFLADMGPRPKGTSLSRFGDSGDYKPSNCAWHTPVQQAAEHKKKLRRTQCPTS